MLPSSKKSFHLFFFPFACVLSFFTNDFIVVNLNFFYKAVLRINYLTFAQEKAIGQLGDLFHAEKILVSRRTVDRD